MFFSPFIGSLMTDSCLSFLRVRAVLCLESLSYLTWDSSHGLIIGSPIFWTSFPAWQLFCWSGLAPYSPVPSKIAILFPIYFSQQENSGISGEKSDQWTNSWISLPLSKLQGSRALASSGLVCSSYQGALTSLCCVWGRVKWATIGPSHSVDSSLMFLFCTLEGKQCYLLVQS